MAPPCLLIVDDEREMAEFVADIAEGLGFACAIATSAEDGICLYNEHHPIGIVMDVIMPDMDGIEFIQELAKLDCTAPIIVMSGYKHLYIDLIETIASSRQTIVIGGLSKPFKPEELEELLNQILETLN